MLKIDTILVIFIQIWISTNARDLIFPTTAPANRDCTTNDNRAGVCRNIRDCPAESLTGDNKFPKVCGFGPGKFNLIVCCLITTDSSSVNSTAPILLKRVESPRINFDCGIQGTVITALFANRASTCFRNERVTPQTVRSIKRKRSTFEQFDFEHQVFAAVGGIDAVQSSWPWMALFGRMNDNKLRYFCDGVLINDDHVLTAAHCVLSNERFFIRFGEHNFELDVTGSAEPFNVDYANITIHPQYKLNQGHHDLAIIKLAHKITIQDDVRPVCLPWGTPSNIDLLGECVIITGWGANRFAGLSTPHLQEVEVEVFDPADCHESYSTLANFESRFPEGINYDNTLCAGDKAGGKDACEGDSGGPLVHFEDGKWILGGIISQGVGCGLPNFPGLYAPLRNLNYLRWIKDIAFS